MATVQFGMRLDGKVDPTFVPSEEQLNQVQREQKRVREDLRRGRFSSSLPAARTVRLAASFQREAPFHSPLWEVLGSPENIVKVERNLRKSSKVIICSQQRLIFFVKLIKEVDRKEERRRRKKQQQKVQSPGSIGGVPTDWHSLLDQAEEEEERKSKSGLKSKMKKFFRSPPPPMTPAAGPAQPDKTLSPPSSTDSDIARRLDNAPSPPPLPTSPELKQEPETPTAGSMLWQASAYLSGKVG